MMDNKQQTELLLLIFVSDNWQIVIINYYYYYLSIIIITLKIKYDLNHVFIADLNLRYKSLDLNHIHPAV